MIPFMLGKTVKIPLAVHARLKVAAATKGESIEIYTVKLIERGLPPTDKGKKNG